MEAQNHAAAPLRSDTARQSTARQVVVACLIVAAAVGAITFVRAATTVRVRLDNVQTRHVVNYHSGVGTCRPSTADGGCPGVFVRLLPQIETPDDVPEDVVAAKLGIELPGQVDVSAVCGSSGNGITEILYPTGTRYTYRVRTSPPFFRQAVTSRVMTSFVPDGRVECLPAAG
ncbi:hypothetical protein [Spelaeicoccus albus]|uniref:Uncharacterized protein n=1 Tax=Spelaeicoccus albus TaxID=1280376 RepID=A0A7Z0AAL0_9MICO|nr:hypothetical protein [Spelaeicoccus albus]NYI67337.1 hypothetical protein [Spelaeicoccus albus]